MVVWTCLPQFLPQTVVSCAGQQEEPLNSCVTRWTQLDQNFCPTLHFWLYSILHSVLFNSFISTSYVLFVYCIQSCVSFALFYHLELLFPKVLQHTDTPQNSSWIQCFNICLTFRQFYIFPFVFLSCGKFITIAYCLKVNWLATKSNLMTCLITLFYMI